MFFRHKKTNKKDSSSSHENTTSVSHPSNDLAMTTETSHIRGIAGTTSRNPVLNETASSISMSNETSPNTSRSIGSLYGSSISSETYSNDEVTSIRSSLSVASGMEESKQTITTKTRDQTEDPDNLVETDPAYLDIPPNDRRKVSAAPSSRLALACSKHPGHKEFIPIRNLNIHNLPPPYQSQDWVNFIQQKGEDTVQIVVRYTSTNRPDNLGFVSLKGTGMNRYGSGTAFIANMDKTEDCRCSEIPGVHKVSGCFKVMTVAHVVFNDEEAKSTVFRFFYDDEYDTSTVVVARGVKVSHIDVERSRSVIECRTHDLTLYQRLLHAQQERLRLTQSSLAGQVNNEPMVVMISHPHGMPKKVSIGKLLDMKEDGEIKTTKGGVELIGCIMTYDTPTCPGTGGGSINLIGHGEVCSAFAPHCASKSNGTNISGLGWTKYVKTMQFRV